MEANVTSGGSWFLNRLQNIWRAFFCAIIFVAAASTALQSREALATGRIGLGLGVGMGTGFSVSYDHAAVLAKTWSLGGEFYGTTSDTLLGGVRLLYWQNPGALSGFYGGPKLFVALGGTTGVGFGGEGGWLYRFGTRIDLGAAIDVIFANSFYGGLKLNIGYLL